MNIKPFRPFLFRQDLKDVTSPPFDVITRQQEKSLKESTYNITHVTLPDSGSPEASRQLVDTWIRDGILVPTGSESLIVITQDFRGNGKDFCRIGLIAPVETSPPSDIIMPHEKTFEWAVRERRELMSSTGCQLEPIFVAVNGISFERMLKSAIKQLAPARTFEEPTGVINRFYVVSEKPAINSITKAVRKDKAIVADGHHRLQATRDLFAGSKRKDRDFWRYSLAYVTSLQQESLMISGIHRLLDSDYSFRNFIQGVESFFEVIGSGPSDNPDLITIYDGKYHTLVPRENAFEAIGDFGKFRFKADPALVNVLIFEKIMGMSIHEIARRVKYTQSVPFAVEEVDRNRSGFAVLMPEWDKSVFLTMTEQGRMFPQKSTYFYPKIPSGIAVYCDEKY